MLLKHHKAINLPHAQLQKYNWMLMFHWPNLKTSIAMHVDLPYFKMLKTWEKMPRGELATQ